MASAPDVVWEMFRVFAQQMMDAGVENLCGVGYGEVSPAPGELLQRLPAPGAGYPGGHHRAAVPKLLHGSYVLRGQ